MQVVLFYDLLDDLSDSGNEQEQVRNVMNIGISGVLVRTIMYHMCIRSTVVLSRCQVIIPVIVIIMKVKCIMPYVNR